MCFNDADRSWLRRTPSIRKKPASKAGICRTRDEDEFGSLKHQPRRIAPPGSTLEVDHHHHLAYQFFGPDPSPGRSAWGCHPDRMRLALGRHSFHSFQGGYIGVDVFFVLSGFIITLLLIVGRPTYRTFMWGRIRRLYPPLLGLLIFGTLLVWVWPQVLLPMDDTIRNAPISAAQLSSFWQAVDDTLQPPFGISWSLAIEWYFYLLWPFLVLRLRNLPARRAAVASLGLAGLLYAGSLPLPNSYFYFGPTARFAELLVGASLGRSGSPTTHNRRHGEVSGHSLPSPSYLSPRGP